MAKPDNPISDYRPDIDTMRAVAVIVILLFHFHIPPFTGGFIGVDIFFVISGFLITRIISVELRQGIFSFSGFYSRRIRRIAPALAAMVVASVAAGSVLLLPSDFAAFAWSAVAALGMVSNIFFWRQSGYFGPAAELQPLLHTWSLGVEEQVYLLMPLAAWLCWKWASRRLPLFFLFAALISFALAVYLVWLPKTSMAFFLMPTRFWEFMAGGLLALFRPPAMPRALATLAVVLGLGMIVYCAVTYTMITAFPGLAAIPPVLGTALIIWAGQGGHALMPLFQLRPVLFIGLISYSLYLWHWPIVTFARYYFIEPMPMWLSLALLGLSVLVSALSWKFIEQRFRSGRKSTSTGLLAVGAALAASLAAVFIVPSLNRFPPDVVKLNSSSQSMWRCDLQAFIPFGSSLACSIDRNATIANADVVLWGDSHALVLVPALEQALQERGLHGLAVNINSCPPAVSANHSAFCRAGHERVLRQIEAMPHVSTVIVSLYWQRYVNLPFAKADGQPAPDGLIGAIGQTVAALQAAGKNVIVVGPIATPEYDVAGEWSRAKAFGHDLNRPLAVERSEFEHDMLAVNRFLAALDKQPGAATIHPSQALCDETQCAFLQDGEAVHADFNHLTPNSARKIKPALAEALDRVKQNGARVGD